MLSPILLNSSQNEWYHGGHPVYRNALEKVTYHQGLRDFVSEESLFCRDSLSISYLSGSSFSLPFISIGYFTLMPVDTCFELKGLHAQ